MAKSSPKDSRVGILLYKEGEEVPVRDALRAASDRVKEKLIAAIRLLRDMGHTLRRP